MFAKECSRTQGENGSQCARRVGLTPSLYGFVQRGFWAIFAGLLLGRLPWLKSSLLWIICIFRRTR